MNYGKAYTDAIVVGSRMRPADAAKVASLAESIQAVGLINPIAVWTQDDSTIHLVAGRHRFEACLKLGWREIDCVFLDVDDIDRQIIEIDENLIRSELTPAQEAEHLKRRKELWEARRNSGNTVSTLTGRGNKGFAQDTAEKTGQTKQSINEKVSRATAVDPIVFGEITTTEAGASVTGQDLDTLKTLTPEEQRQAWNRVKAGDSATVRDAHNFIRGVDPDEEKSRKWRASFTRLIANAPSQHDLEWAMEQLDRPVFDSTEAA